MAQHFLLSSAARTLSLTKVARMSEEEAREAFRLIRWADSNGEPHCPSCGCFAILSYKSRPFSTNPETDYDAKIVGQADRSIAIAHDDMNAYGAKGMYLNITLRPNDALRDVNAGLAINSNSAYLHGIRASVETYLRQFEQARSDVEQAMRLSPRDPRIAQWHAYLGIAELGLGHLDAAIEEISNAIDAGYRIWYCYVNLAAARALKGEMDQAKDALAEARRRNPKLSVKYLVGREPVLQPAFDALRKAGLPEE